MWHNIGASLRDRATRALHRVRILGLGHSASVPSAVVAAYQPKCNRHFQFKDELGKDFPRWMNNIALGGFREQGWAAYEQPSGRQIASGAWGDELLLLGDGTIVLSNVPTPIGSIP